MCPPALTTADGYRPGFSSMPARGMMVVKGGSMGPGDFQTPGTGLVVMVWQDERRGGHDQHCWKGWSPGKGENQEPERD